METSFGWSTTKKPGLAALQPLSSREHCLTMPLPSRSWNVPWSKKLNMVEAKLKNDVFRGSPSTIHCRWFGRNVPSPPFTRLNQLKQGALRLLPWIRLREASFFLKEKGKETATPTHPANQPFHPTTYFLSLVTPWRSLFPQVPFLHHQGKPLSEWKPLT